MPGVVRRADSLPLPSALICAALGFSLASTGLAPMIGQVNGQIVGVISSLGA